MSETPEAIGWKAIDTALAKTYGDREPKHYGTILPAALGGDDPLQGISVYKNTTPDPHYHFVTYGFSELYEKESENLEYSGYGFELTFRLACDAKAGAEPPMWPLSFLQNIARYVFSTGNLFDEGHHMTLHGPIAHGEDTDITAILFMLDPQLDPMNTRNGKVKFLQVVGLCEDEYRLTKQGYHAPVVERVVDLTLLSLTDIYRESILEDEQTLADITAEEPFFTEPAIFGTVAEWTETGDELRLRFGATLVPQIKTLLKGRLRQGDPLDVVSKSNAIPFRPAESNGWTVENGRLEISITAETAALVADQLKQVRGVYACPAFPGLKIEVVPVKIKDGDGKVIDELG